MKTLVPAFCVVASIYFEGYVNIFTRRYWYLNNIILLVPARIMYSLYLQRFWVQAKNQIVCTQTSTKSKLVIAPSQSKSKPVIALNHSMSKLVIAPSQSKGKPAIELIMFYFAAASANRLSTKSS